MSRFFRMLSSFAGAASLTLGLLGIALPMHQVFANELIIDGLACDNCQLTDLNNCLNNGDYNQGCDAPGTECDADSGCDRHCDRDDYAYIHCECFSN